MKRTIPALGLIIATVVSLKAGSAALTDDTVREFAVCAAYFFNATKVKPMAEYDGLYRAGESLLNRARSHLSAAELERVMADASIDMNDLIEGDWRQFSRVTARHGERCQTLSELRPVADN